ncbi:NACHT domain-containing protein [Amycolatopsis sp. cmx-4-68]|uniref:NACHT domain-containing protein n=1 Tax=Amycolatopsis sp. cmx-4-68 TaxID=2790938 RepID=UPI00397AB6CD
MQANSINNLHLTCTASGPPRADTLKSLLKGQLLAARQFPYQLRPATVALDSCYVEQTLEPLHYPDLATALNVDPEVLAFRDRTAGESDLDEYVLRLARLQYRPSASAGPESEVRGLGAFHRMTRSARTGRADLWRRVVAELSPRPTAAQLADAAKPRNVVIIGAAAAGKTTLTLQLAAHIARQNDPQGPVSRLALRVRAVDLVTERRAWLDAVLRCAEAELSHHLTCRLPDQLSDLVSGIDDFTIIIDGLDEIRDRAERNRLLENLRDKMADTAETARYVVTSRPLADDELEVLHEASPTIYALRNFTAEQIREFADQWFSGLAPAAPGAGEFLRDVELARLQNTVSNPLFATITAIVFCRPDGRPLPNNRFDLIENFLAEIFEKSSHGLEEMREATHARFASSSDDRIGEKIDKLFRSRVSLLEVAAKAHVDGSPILPAVHEWVTEHVGATTSFGSPGREDFLEALLHGTGVVKPSPTGPGFVDRSIAEHLTSRLESRRLPKNYRNAPVALAKLAERALTGDHRAIGTLVDYGRKCADHGDFLRWLRSMTNKRPITGTLMANGFPRDQRSLETFERDLRDKLQRQTPWESDTEGWWETATRLRVESLDQLVAEVATSDGAQSTAALRALMTFQPETAVAALSELASSPLAPPDMRWEKFAMLTQLGDTVAVSLIGLLETILRDSSVSMYVCLGLVQLSIARFPRHLELIEEKIFAMAEFRYLSAVDHIILARLMAKLGLLRSRERAVQSLRSVAKDRAERPDFRLFACDELFAIDPEERATVAEVQREVAKDPGVGTRTRIHAFQGLAVSSPASSAVKTSGLRNVLKSREDSDASEVLWAASALIGLGTTDDQEIALALRDVVADPKTGERQAARARELLSRLDVSRG